MTSTAAAREALPGVRGIVFFGFPLHAPGKASDERGNHLFEVDLPMLFLQGTRDRLAELALLRPLCDRLRDNARLHVIDGADHGFHVPKRSGRSDEDVLVQLAETVAAWATAL
jgi:predicted alpha/beta-hydrolase family hydrolase